MRFGDKTHQRTSSQWVIFCLAGTLFCGCRSIGPGSVQRDRSDYVSAITESWKSQTLLNIVKLRYLDPPIFVDVGQIVAGYSLEVDGSMGGTVAPQIAGGDSLSAGVAGKYIDRPTITYTPLTGNKFIKSLMTPIPPEVLFNTIQSGWPADGMLLAAVTVINGLKNEEVSASGVSLPDGNFVKAIQLLRKIQLSGAVGIQVEHNPDKRETTLITFRSLNITPETLTNIMEFRQLLHLDPVAREFHLNSSAAQANPQEIAILTRSVLHIMMAMASQVDVPPQHIQEGRATHGWETANADAERTRLLVVHSSKSRPADAFVAVRYRGYWFWIDDCDLKSKRSFNFMMLLFTLTNPEGDDKMPVLTIPTQ